MSAGEEDYEANKKAVEAICDEDINRTCCDCGSTGTRWASVNHGVFVCIRCSGIHRSLGVHISKVKSTNMDKWTAAEVQVMKLIGNRTARALYEARLPAREKPSEGESESVVKEFIVKKYSEKKYAAPDWVPALKKVFKTAGYKAGRKELKAKEESAAAAGGDAAADDDGSKKKSKSSGEGKKSSKAASKAAGLFGAVTVPDDVHDERLAATLTAFGLAVPVAAAAAAAAASGDENAEEGAAAAAATDDKKEEQASE